MRSAECCWASSSRRSRSAAEMSRIRTPRTPEAQALRTPVAHASQTPAASVQGPYAAPTQRSSGGRAARTPGAYAPKAVVVHAPSSRPAWPSSQRGSVTAELAVLLPGVVLASVVILVAASAGVAQVRCADAARAGARAAALGKSPEEISAIAEDLAGPSAEVGVTESGQWVRVQVSLEVPLGPLSGALSADASFAALPEPTDPAGGSSVSTDPAGTDPEAASGPN